MKSFWQTVTIISDTLWYSLLTCIYYQSRMAYICFSETGLLGYNYLKRKQDNKTTNFQLFSIFWFKLKVQSLLLFSLLQFLPIIKMMVCTESIIFYQLSAIKLVHVRNKFAATPRMLFNIFLITKCHVHS